MSKALIAIAFLALFIGAAFTIPKTASADTPQNPCFANNVVFVLTRATESCLNERDNANFPYPFTQMVYQPSPAPQQATQPLFWYAPPGTLLGGYYCSPGDPFCPSD